MKKRRRDSGGEEEEGRSGKRQRAVAAVFDGVVAYVVPHSIGKVQLAAFVRNLSARGGQVEPRPSQRVTHVIAASSAALTSLSALERLDLQGSKFVSTEWLTQSLQLNQQLHERQFALSLTGAHVSPPRTSTSPNTNVTTSAVPIVTKLLKQITPPPRETGRPLSRPSSFKSFSLSLSQLAASCPMSLSSNSSDAAVAAVAAGDTITSDPHAPLVLGDSAISIGSADAWRHLFRSSNQQHSQQLFDSGSDDLDGDLVDGNGTLDDSLSDNDGDTYDLAATHSEGAIERASTLELRATNRKLDAPTTSVLPAAVLKASPDFELEELQEQAGVACASSVNSLDSGSLRPSHSSGTAASIYAEPESQQLVASGYDSDTEYRSHINESHERKRKQIKRLELAERRRLVLQSSWDQGVMVQPSVLAQSWLEKHDLTAHLKDGSSPPPPAAAIPAITATTTTTITSASSSQEPEQLDTWLVYQEEDANHSDSLLDLAPRSRSKLEPPESSLPLWIKPESFVETQVRNPKLRARRRQVAPARQSLPPSTLQNPLFSAILAPSKQPPEANPAGTHSDTESDSGSDTDTEYHLARRSAHSPKTPNAGVSSNTHCYRYNSWQGCRSSQCRWKHICARCSGPHSRVECTLPSAVADDRQHADTDSDADYSNDDVYSQSTEPFDAREIRDDTAIPTQQSTNVSPRSWLLYQPDSEDEFEGVELASSSPSSSSHPVRRRSSDTNSPLSSRSESDEHYTQAQAQQQKPRLRLSPQRARLFACQRSPDKELKPGEQLNANIVQALKTLEEHSRNTGDQWRALAYRKAVAAVSALNYRLTSVHEAKKLRGVGQSIANKIAEIISTGTLRRISQVDDLTQTINLFSKVWGAGPHACKKWFAKGYRTLDDLRAHTEDLTKQQLIGLQYFEEFQERIPRAEVMALERIVFQHLVHIDKDLRGVTCGSYRRGAATCGDIDILITHAKGASLEGVLHKLVTRLHQAQFLTDDLSYGSGGDKYMGVCILPTSLAPSVAAAAATAATTTATTNPDSAASPRAPYRILHRRIDFQLIPAHEWPCALLYFTGSGHFNRSMRLWARKNGFSLSEKALVPRITEDLTGPPVPVHTEKDVFDALGLEYKAPEERDI